MGDFLNGFRKSPTNTSNICLKIHQKRINTYVKIHRKYLQTDFEKIKNKHQQIRTTISQKYL